MSLWSRVLILRIVKSFSFWGSIAFALAMAAASRGHGGASSVLPGGVGLFVLPVALFSAISAASEQRGVRGLIAFPLGFGRSPVQVILWTAGALIVFCAALSALLGLLVAVIAHTDTDPPLVRDAISSAWALGVSGGAYASLFLLGGSYGKRGGGAQFALMADYLFGGGNTGVARWLPRAHVQRVLGDESLLSWSNRASMAALWGIGLVFFVLLALRATRLGRAALERQAT